MGDRTERERTFHNRSYTEGPRARASAYYAAARGARAHYRSVIKRHGRNAEVLECGCGTGGSARMLRNRAASIVGIDISDEAVRLARERHAGIPGTAVRRFQRMDAESLDFPDGSFDLVCGTAVLHHLDLDRACAEIVRVLRPGGHAVFLEPLAHNPLINLYRRLSPAMRTVDEHPFKMRDLEAVAGHFAEADHRFFALHTLATLPLRRFRFFGRIERRAERADEWAFRRMPFLRRYAWIVVSEYSNRP
jgi:SAM-dependent methyltransferase